MKHIQKRFLLEGRNVLDGAASAEAAKAQDAAKISGTPEQMTALDESLASRMKLQADVTKQLLEGNGGEQLVQTLLTGAGLDTGGIDGILGAKSQKAIKEVQSFHNLPKTGVVDDATAIAIVKTYQQLQGLKDDGIIGKNTLARIKGAPSGTVNHIKRKPKYLLEHMFGAKGEKTDALASIDGLINANNKKLLPLQGAIIEAKKSGKNLDRVYADTIAAIAPKLDNKTNKLLQSLTSTKDKISALDYISQALWGSAKTVNVAQGKAESSEYVRSRKKAFEILKKQGFSSTLINGMKSKVAALQKDMKGNLPTERREGFMYTVRSQGSLSTTEPVTNQELVGINGEFVWDIPQTKADMQNYVNDMNTDQVAKLIKAWGIGNGVRGKTHAQRKARIKQHMETTGKKLDIKLVFAENCGNIGMVAIPTKMQAKVWEGEGTTTTGNDPDAPNTPDAPTSPTQQSAPTVDAPVSQPDVDTDF